MNIINPEHIKTLLERINCVPYFELLSMEVCELDRGYSRIEVEIEKKHLNPFGGVHGGAYCSIVDTAAYWAIYCDIGEDIGYTSLDLTIDYLAPLKEGRLIAEGRSIKVGRTICSAEVTITNVQGKLLAHGTSKLIIVAGMQPVNRTVEIGTDKLPVKFLPE